MLESDLTLGIPRDWHIKTETFSRAIASENDKVRHANPEGSPKLSHDQTFIIPIITWQFKRIYCTCFHKHNSEIASTGKKLSQTFRQKLP